MQTCIWQLLLHSAVVHVNSWEHFHKRSSRSIAVVVMQLTVRLVWLDVNKAHFAEAVKLKSIAHYCLSRRPILYHDEQTIRLTHETTRRSISAVSIVENVDGDRSVAATVGAPTWRTVNSGRQRWVMWVFDVGRNCQPHQRQLEGPEKYLCTICTQPAAACCRWYVRLMWVTCRLNPFLFINYDK